MPQFNPRTIAVSCAAALSVPTAIMIARFLGPRRKKAEPPFDTVPVRDWGQQQVGQWLRSIGVSETAVAAFRGNEVDGSVLFLLKEEDIAALAPKMRDRLLIQRGLEELRKKAKHYPPPPSTKPASATEATLSTVDAEEEKFATFMKKLNVIVAVFTSDEFAQAPPSIQRAQRQKCIECFQVLLEEMQGFTPQLQKELTPVVKKVEALILRSQTSNATTAIPDSSNLATQLNTLNEMVDGFLRVIESTDVSVMSDPQISSLRDRVESQIRQVVEVTRRLPPQYGDPLQKKCALVLQKIQLASAAAGKEAAPAPAPAPASPAPASAPAPVPVEGTTPANRTREAMLLEPQIKRLRTIFAALKSSQLMSMEPQERLSRIAAMIGDVQAIQQEASSWNDTRAVEVINQVAGNITTVLRQVETLTREEITAMQGGGNDEGDNADHQMKLPQIVASLQAIMQVLHSDELANAPHEVQQQMISQLQQSLFRLRQEVGRLPANQATASIAAMIDKANELVSSLKDGEVENTEDENENKSSTDVNAPRETRSNNIRMPAPLSAGAANPLEMEWESNVLDGVVLELEKMFECINSKEYETMNPEKKRQVTQKNLTSLGEIEKRCAQYDGFDQLRELIDPLKEILAAEMRREEQSSTVPVGTALFQNISSHLGQMRKLMSSEGFQRADMDRKRNAAKSIIPQLRKIASTLSLLSPEERAVVERLMVPINETLKSIVSGNEEASPITTGSTPQRIVSQIEEVLSVLQSEEFRSVSVPQRQHIAAGLLQKIKGLEEECAHTGSATEPLLSILLRLQSQLQMFGQPGEIVGNAATAAVATTLVDDEEEEGEGEEEEEEEEEEILLTDEQARMANIQEERRKLFRAVSDITSELRKGQNKNVFLSPEEVEPLLGLLGMMDSVGCTTGREKKLRDKFEAQIRRAAGENVTVGDETGKMNLQRLVHIFGLLKNRLSTTPPSSPSELFSIMSAVEETLGGADEENVQWRSNPQVVAVIGEVLTRIQQAQVEMSGQAANRNAGSPLNDRISEEAAESLHGTAGQNPSPANVMSQSGERGDNRPNDSLENLQNRRGVAPFIPDSAAAGAGATNTPHGNQQEEGEEEDARSAESRIAQMLLGISDQLRESSVPDELLDRYSMLLSLIESSCTDPSFQEAIESIRGQIHLQRLSNRNSGSEESSSMTSNDDDDDDDDEEGINSGKESTSRQLSSENMGAGEVKTSETPVKVNDKEETQVTSPTATTTTTTTDMKKSEDIEKGENSSEVNTFGKLLSQLTRDGVPGGARNELLLLPRIEKRIFSDEQHFIENTRLFDIQAMSKIILHLENNDEVKGNQALKDRVNHVKKVFARQLEAFHCSDRKSIAVQSFLRVCCRDMFVEGEFLREILICTTAEADQREETGESKELMKSITEGPAVEPTVTSEIIDEWTDRSLAVIICEGENSVAGTELSELVLLREVLVNRYGFEVTVTKGSNAQKMRDLLQEIAASGTKRLFVFCLTDPCTSSPLSILFRDGSVLTLREALQNSLVINRVVIAHCQPQRLTVLSALNGTGGRFLSVELTEAARNEIQEERCWLYDGLLTSSITELLSLDNNRVLCPEDLATYTVTALSPFKVDLGSFTEGESLSMGFFVSRDSKIQVK